MKKKILFLCGHYNQPEFANSICIANLANEYIRQGHEVFVISKHEHKNYKGSDSDGVKVYWIRENFYPKIVAFFSSKKSVIYKMLFNVVQMIRYAYVISFYPNISPLNSLKYYKLAKKLIDAYGIDVVISSYMPYESIHAGMRLKKKYGNEIRFVTYHLDLLNSPSNYGLVKIIKLQINKQALKNELNIVDKMLLPTTAEFHDSPKIEYVDFPLYITEIGDKRGDFKFPSDKVNVTFVGSMSSENRSPLYAIGLLSSVKQISGKPIAFHVWGSIGDKACSDALKSEMVCYHGFAESEEVRGLLMGSDFLVNLGNKITYRMLPSKIFQYFSTSKPIIDFVKHPEDSSLPYFTRYGHCVVVPEYEREEKKKHIEELKDFMSHYYGASFDVDAKLFEKSTPKYICSAILSTSK